MTVIINIITSFTRSYGLHFLNAQCPPIVSSTLQRQQ